MTTNNPSPLSARALISRITLPFAAKTKNISEFYIKTAEPHRQYAPGDVVKGSVILTVNKPVRITHLVVCIRGFVKVYKNPNPPGQGISKEAASIGTGRGERGSEYFGNGFATIFEKELALCGEGRLHPTVYSFEFELPVRSWGVPSSIDFERGTISYLLTATLTRPTTISPTSTCDRNIHVVESIDIARLRKPKARVFSLEPLARRTRSRHHPKSSSAGTDDRGTPKREDAGPTGDAAPSLDPAVTERTDEPPQSPVPSEISSVSAISSSNVSSGIGNGAARGNQGNDSRSTASVITEKTVIAEAEVLRGGCLPGDLVPVRIKIEHTKPIKSVHGIIITLYRQGRMDTYPPLPVGPRIVGQKPKYEEYYPKSRTGLSGLSLSSAGTVHLYRMDLAQTFAPLIVDPVKMTTVVQTSVRVPDDVFPTISCVPGDIISFKYYVEIVIDLAGKLATQGRFFPRISMTGVPAPSDYAPGSNQSINLTQGNFQTLSTNFANTDQIRREKSVVFCNFEVVMGTKDTERKNLKRPAMSREDCTMPPWSYESDHCLRETQIHRDTAAPAASSSTGGPLRPHDQRDLEDHTLRPMAPVATPLYVPPERDDLIDEKTWLRRAEECLLPSAPPLDDEGISSTLPIVAPSAPSQDVLEAAYLHYEPSAPVYDGPTSAMLAAMDADTETTADHHHDRFATMDDRTNDTQWDKQELERQRLLAAASSPDDGVGVDSEAPGCQAMPTPSAPVLHEGDEYHFPHDHPSGTEYLPRYLT